MFPETSARKIRRSLAPPPKLTVSEWADRYRQLSPEASGEPGQWRTDRAEYLRGIMDAVSDPEVDMVVIMSSSQIGKTEILNNIVGFHISQDPAPMLMVQPTLPMAEAYSKDRLSKMVRDTPALRRRIRDPRAKDSENTILHKTFPGGHITVAGANSPASLASRPVRVALCDEVDRYNPSAGTEGDPVELARARTSNFWNRFLILASTPGIKGISRIENAFMESDQRYFYVPCPHCGRQQRLIWDQVKWKKKTKGKKVIRHSPETALYHCEYCRKPWSEPQRLEAVRRGEWIASKPEHAGIAGFHVWAAYSPWASLPDLAKDFLNSKGHPERFKTFINTKLGEPWELRGKQLSPHELFNRRERYKAEVPAGGLVLTAAVDVQADRLEVEVIAWGIGEESWSIEYKVLYGDPGTPKVWDSDLDDYLNEVFEHESGIRLRISCATVDTGYQAEMAYRFCRGRGRRRIFAIKGANTIGKPLISPPSRNNKHRIPLFTVGTDTAKQKIQSYMSIEEPGPGYMHFPERYDQEYFEQLTAEKQVTNYRKNIPYREWVKIRPRNEALDLRVYNFAALEILNPNFEKIAKIYEKKAQESGDAGREPAKKKSAARKSRKGWLKK